MMEEVSKDKILEDMIDILRELTADWEYDGEINSDTVLFHDLGFQSIDAVVLGTNIEEYYKQSLPFAGFLTDLGQEGVENLTVGQLVEFVQNNLNKTGSGTE
jgi:acyl carrier protein